MDQKSRAVRLLGLCGSLRRGSYNMAILRTIGAVLDGSARLDVFELGAVPLYNADHDGDAAPPPVRALREAVADSDALVIASPEYNYGIPGVLKNAIDWASRPAFQSVLKDKPVLILTASPSLTGGARAQAQIREVLLATLARVMPGPDLLVPQVKSQVVEGRLHDEESMRRIMTRVDALVRIARAARA